MELHKNDLGFEPCEKPMNTTERYRKMLRDFTESEDVCVKRVFADLKGAKAMQATLSAIVRKEFPSLKCQRVDAAVYVMKE